MTDFFRVGGLYYSCEVEQELIDNKNTKITKSILGVTTVSLEKPRSREESNYVGSGELFSVLRIEEFDKINIIYKDFNPPFYDRPSNKLGIKILLQVLNIRGQVGWLVVEREYSRTTFPYLVCWFRKAKTKTNTDTL